MGTPWNWTPSETSYSQSDQCISASAGCWIWNIIFCQNRTVQCENTNKPLPKSIGPKWASNTFAALVFVNWWHDPSQPSFRRLRPYFGIPGTAVRQSSRPCAWRCPIHVIYGDLSKKNQDLNNAPCESRGFWPTNMGILIELNQTNLVYRSTCFNRFFSTLKQ